MSFFDRKKINIETTNKCTLKCQYCFRQINDNFKDMKKVTGDMSLEDFKKVADHFDDISFCGLWSDPVYNPNLDRLLSYAYLKNRDVYISTASPHKNMNWYRKLFLAHPKATWIFGIDGLIDTSPIHRVNQDTEKLFRIMFEAKKFGVNTQWQYLVFSHNEHQIEQAKKIAKKMGIEIFFLVSDKFNGVDDPFIPSEKFFDKEKITRSKEVNGRYLEPKCFKNNSFGHSAMGYITPCCWTSNGNVEKDYPELCNEKTKISNVNSIEEILNSEGYQKFYDTLLNDPQNAPQKCWRKCSSNSTEKIMIKEI